MLLSVALALLVAQVLAGVLLFRAEQRRQEFGLINGLAFQLVSEPRITYRQQRPGEARREERRRQRLVDMFENPAIQRELRDPEREEALRGVLEEQDVAIAELLILTRDFDDPRFGRISEDPPGWQDRDRRFGPDDRVALAGLKRTGEDRWRFARMPLPQRNVGAMRGVIIQTVILYVVLVGGLALLLRRITRPLAALTRRVEQFGGTANGDAPLEPSGPEDTRRLIAAHGAMEARIAALLDEKDVMLGAIGHDLKTPLAALRVRIESVEDEGERARMARTIEDITRTLDDILSLARVGRPSDPLERTDLGALLASVVEEYEDMGENVELHESERLAMPLRATWLRRAIRNLVSNALRYGGEARISLERASGEAVIRVEDSGPGIPDDQLAQMLEPFQRGETSRNRETGGAGLGLTLARAIAEQHGGTLRLANRLGVDGKVAGLVAEIRLPV